MPTYLGTLQLSEQQEATLEEHGVAMIARHTEPDGHVPAKNRKIPTTTALALENVAYGYVHPNVLDVKLGVRLWADDANIAKKTRFDIVTKETTHRNLGFRIAGMRVWQGCDAAVAEVDDQDGYKIYDKNYGRFAINDDNVEEAFQNFIYTESAGITKELGNLVSQAFLADLATIQAVLESQESRMYSASLLFVFEGDGKALQAAMEEASARPLVTVMTSDGYIEGTGEEEIEDEDEEDDSNKSAKIYDLKIIDFAHAEWTPGLGPDENALLGVRSISKILEKLTGDI